MSHVFVDSHCHMSDSRLDDRRDEVLKTAYAQNIHFFLQGGVSPEDWQKQLDLKKRWPGILPSFGLHPYWIHDHSLEECEQALDQLSQNLHLCDALGEMGLDFRDDFLSSEEKQIDFFTAQLELSQVTQKPVVLHIVKAHAKACQILDFFGLPPRGGFVHAFNGTAVEAQDFLDRDLLLSVGGPLVFEKNQKLREAVQMIPLEKLLIESDSPDQPPPQFEKGKNEPISIFHVADVVAEIKNLTRNEVLEQSRLNLQNLLGFELVVYGNRTN